VPNLLPCYLLWNKLEAGIADTLRPSTVLLSVWELTVSHTPPRLYTSLTNNLIEILGECAQYADKLSAGRGLSEVLWSIEYCPFGHQDLS
jgi:hypothetical protein